MNSWATWKRERALVVGNLGARHRRGILGCLQAMLALFAAFKQVAQPDVALGGVVQIIQKADARRGGKRKVFPIGEEA